MNQPLPKYDKPPVIEVALSVQFGRLDVTVAHLGLAWQQFRNRFPLVQQKPEVEPTIEQFGAPKQMGPDIRFEVGTVPFPRLWFVSDSGNELVQVQRDRFTRNWRKTEDEPGYPSYDILRESFVSDWELFTAFMSEQAAQPVVPVQCEVTYVNILEDIESGKLHNLMSWISGKYSDDYLGDPEDAELTLRYVLQDESKKPWCRLHITTMPAIRSSDNKPVLRMSLTARGSPLGQCTEDMLAWLDNAHEAIVRAFTSITTDSMHKEWERKQ